MTITYVATGIVLLAYVILVWLTGGWLHLKSPDIWVFRGGLALIGIGAAAAFVWWKRHACRPRAETLPSPSMPLMRSTS